MTPQEIQKQNIESTKIPEKEEWKNENLNIPKSATLSKYPNFDVFTKTLNTIDSETKAKLLAILGSIPEDELTMYIEMDADNSNLITEDDIKRFIKEKAIYTPKLNTTINDTIDLKTETLKENWVWNLDQEKTAKEENKKINKTNFSLFKEKLPLLTKAFQNNNEILDILNKITWKYNEQEQINKLIWDELLSATEKNQNDIKDLLNNYFSNKDNAKEFFQTLNEKNPELYKETYNAVIAISPELKNNFTAWWIPSEPYKVEKPIPEKPDDKAIISQFPWAKPEDIEKRWDLVSYGDKTIDLKTGKAFISGEWWYAIETSMKVPNSLDLRVKYQKERLEIIDEIKTNEKILHLLENKETLKQKLETLKNNKSTQEKSAQDLQIDIEINAIETEIKKINEKLKIAIPWYSEEQDNNLKTFLKEKITQSQEKLTALKTKFDEDMQKLLEAWQDEILARDKKVRETMSFLDDLWITNINQNDLQKIIDRINIHPHAYGFSKKIDLKAWFEWSPTDALKQKKEFFHLFSKIYEKMNFIPPVNESIIEWFNKDERLKNDTIFKQKLEDIWVTKGWAIQIETVMNILWEKPEERERVYNGKPTQKEKVNEIVETK